MGADKELTLKWSHVPVRLGVLPMTIGKSANGRTPDPPLPLFTEVDGILGASGRSLGCRNQTLWTMLLGDVVDGGVTQFYFDLQPPSSVRVRSSSGKPRTSLESRIFLGAPDRQLLWSQPKQTGDVLNDGMHEFLIYKPTLCDVDLLYNTSSNWLSVIDTSGPCLTLPPFLFDRIMAHIAQGPNAAVKCPFKLGGFSGAQLCTVQRRQNAPLSDVVLPALYFQLEDDQAPMPPRIGMSLERLV